MRSVINLLSAAALCLGLTQSAAWAGPFVNGAFANFDGWTGAVLATATGASSTVDPPTGPQFTLIGGGFAKLANDDSYDQVSLFQSFDLDPSAQTLSFDYQWALTAGDPQPSDFVQALLWLANFSDHIDLFPQPPFDTSAPTGAGTATTGIGAFAGQSVLLEFLLQDGDVVAQDWFAIGNIAITGAAVPLPPTLMLLLPGLGLLARRADWHRAGRPLATL